jgi:hypothetical protein
MNAKTAKRLRKIAAELGLNPKTGYAPGGKLRRRPGYTDELGLWQEGAPIVRPAVLTECTRRAYKEAKKIYMGKPSSILLPEGSEVAPFHVRMVDSIKKQGQGPV